MKQFSPFCSQSPWQAVTTIFSGGPVAALPNYFLKSVKIFLPDSQSKRWRSDFRFDVPLQSKEKKLVTWSWHKTKHKSLCCWTKWALTFIHTHTHKKMNSKKVEKDTKRRRSISCNCLFFSHKWMELLLSLTFCLAWSFTCGQLEAMFRYKGLKSCRNELWWNYLKWENPDWCERQRTPLPAKKNNLLEKY